MSTYGARLAMSIGAWAVCTTVSVVTGDERWLGAAMAMWVHAIVTIIWQAIAVGVRRRRQQRFIERFQQAPDGTGLDDLRWQVSAHQIADRFDALDCELRKPGNLRRRLDASRARRRDGVDPDVRERVAWVELWQQLERDDEDGVTA